MTRDTKEFLSEKLSELNEMLTINAKDAIIGHRVNEFTGENPDSLGTLRQQNNATLIQNNRIDEDIDDTETYVKIPVHQLINTFEKQTCSVIEQKVEAKHLCMDETIEIESDFHDGTSIKQDEGECIARNVLSTESDRNDPGIEQFDLTDRDNENRLITMQMNALDVLDSSATINHNDHLDLPTANEAASYMSIQRGKTPFK